MIKAAPKILALVLIIFAGCGDDETGSILHKIMLFEDDRLLTERIFSYDEEGRVIQILQLDRNNPASHSAPTDFEYTEDQVSFQQGGQSSYFNFHQGQMVSSIYRLEFSEEEVYGDTINFMYDAGELAGFVFDYNEYLIEKDDRGNISRISGTEADYHFEFDNKINPLYQVPMSFSIIGSVTHTKYLQFINIVRYFSKNNATGSGYSVKYTDGKVSRLIHKDGITTWTEKLEYK